LMAVQKNTKDICVVGVAVVYEFHFKRKLMGVSIYLI